MLNESFDSLGERSHPRQWKPDNEIYWLATRTSSHWATDSLIYWPGDREWREVVYQLRNLSGWREVAYWPGDREWREVAYQLGNHSGWSEVAYWPGDLPEWSEVSSILPDEHAVLVTTVLWRWAKAIALNVFVGTFLCQIIFLFLLWDLRSRGLDGGRSEQQGGQPQRIGERRTPGPEFFLEVF